MQYKRKDKTRRDEMRSREEDLPTRFTAQEMERAGGSTRRSKRVIEMKKQETREKCCPKNTSTNAVRASKQDKEDNLGTSKKDVDTQDLMEGAAVALT
eukprot:2947091-Ditylum_brightwellii.AAC.1